MVSERLFAGSSLLALLLAVPAAAGAGMYSKTSPVLQVTGKTYPDLILNSNHTSILEFYAPWCGHCQSLKPAYEKAAKSLAGLAKVAAIDCDDEGNKALCGIMGVQGFPTLKIVQPGAKKGRPTVEEYQGARTAKAIADAVLAKMPNHVKRLGDGELQAWLKDGNATAKAILFSAKAATSPLLKGLAIDFLDGIRFAQIRDKETAACALFGVDRFPTLIVLPGGDQAAVAYDGPTEKEPMVAFLARVKAPNPDPAPKATTSATKAAKAKTTTKTTTTKTAPNDDAASSSDSARAAFEHASSAHASSEASASGAGAASARSISLDEPAVVPSESPDPIVSPSASAHPGAPPPPPKATIPIAPPLPSLATAAQLHAACLRPQSSTCVLVLVPAAAAADDETLASSSAAALAAQASLAEIAHRFALRRAALFPFYAVPATNEGGVALRAALGLPPVSRLALVVVNARRGWWRRYEEVEVEVEVEVEGDGKADADADADAYGLMAVEAWIDAVRLGDGTKERLPDGVVAEPEKVEEKVEKKEEKVAVEVEVEVEQETEDVNEKQPKAAHDEL
ncbi:MAG: hypothetical protein M1826_001965 [Phylliscum demangeonii]|nr:MAG: hypothetical protein M1826_001965 [Phylliscum demangeonii]